MQQYIVLILLFAGSLSLSSQTILNIEDLERFEISEENRVRVRYEVIGKDTVLNGKARIENTKSQSHTLAQFKKNYPNGKWFTYNNTGRETAIYNYNNGYPDGECIDYSSTGAIERKTIYKKGAIDGYAYSYHPDGKTKRVHLYKEGVDIGPEREYSAGDTLTYQAFYQNGLIEGEVFARDIENQYSAIANYTAGQANGAYTETYDSGNPKCLGQYRQGRQDGIWKYIDKATGTPDYEETYQYGVLISTTANTPKLDIPIEQQQPLDSIHRKAIYTQHIIHTVGILNGDYTEIYNNADSTIRVKGKYVNNRKEGTWIYAYPNGSLYRSDTYQNGQWISEMSRIIDQGEIEKVDLIINSDEIIFFDKELPQTPDLELDNLSAIKTRRWLLTVKGDDLLQKAVLHLGNTVAPAEGKIRIDDNEGSQTIYTYASFRNGMRHGVWTTYDNEKLITTQTYEEGIEVPQEQPKTKNNIK